MQRTYTETEVRKMIQDRVAPWIEAALQQLKRARAAEAVLTKLEYWFDTDSEILAAMDADTRADHEAKLAMIRGVLAKARATV